MITTVIIIMEMVEFEQHDKRNSLYFIVYTGVEEVSEGGGCGKAVSLSPNYGSQFQHLFCGDPSIN